MKWNRFDTGCKMNELFSLAALASQVLYEFLTFNLKVQGPFQDLLLKMGHLPGHSQDKIKSQNISRISRFSRTSGHPETIGTLTEKIVDVIGLECLTNDTAISQKMSTKRQQNRSTPRIQAAFGSKKNPRKICVTVLTNCLG